MGLIFSSISKYFFEVKSFTYGFVLGNKNIYHKIEVFLIHARMYGDLHVVSKKEKKQVSK
jgi:hypothetical protein